MADALDAAGRPHPPWMQDRAPMGPPLAELEAARAAAAPPLALKMCAGCTAQYAAEGDVGDEQGGTTWYGPCCPVPERDAAVFIREAAKRHGTEIVITVHGTPAPQGSKRAFAGKDGRAVVVDDNKPALRTWRDDVKKAAEATGSSMLLRPVGIEVQFHLARPRSHYRTGKSTGHLLTGSAPAHPKGKPDLDKLARAVLDALKAAGMYADDAQVIQLYASKSYARRGQPPGAEIRIREIWEQEP